MTTLAGTRGPDVRAGEMRAGGLLALPGEPGALSMRLGGDARGWAQAVPRPPEAAQSPNTSMLAQ